jgi:hypothetical protein
MALKEVEAVATTFGGVPFLKSSLLCVIHCRAPLSPPLKRRGRTRYDPQDPTPQRRIEVASKREVSLRAFDPVPPLPARSGLCAGVRLDNMSTVKARQ